MQSTAHGLVTAAIIQVCMLLFLAISLDAKRLYSDSRSKMAPNSEATSSINFSAAEANGSESSLCKTLFHGFENSINVSLVIILILCVLGNSTICFIVSRHYQLHTVTNAYLVNIAIVQILFVLFTIPPYLRVLHSRLSAERWPCKLAGFSFVFFGACSCFAMALVTFERYYVISESYGRKISVKKTKRMILASYFLALMFAVLWVSTETDSAACSHTPASKQGAVQVSCFLFLNAPNTNTARVINALYIIFCFLLPMTVMVVLFLKISKPLHRGITVIRPLGIANSKSIRFFVEIKTARTMLLVFVLNLSCWVPFCVIGLSKSFKPMDNHTFDPKAQAISICLIFSSTCVNSLVYALRNPRITLMFTKKRRRQKTTVHFSKTKEKSYSLMRSEIWARKSKSVSLFEQSRSEETQSRGQTTTTATGSSAMSQSLA